MLYTFLPEYPVESLPKFRYHVIRLGRLRAVNACGLPERASTLQRIIRARNPRRGKGIHGIRLRARDGATAREWILARYTRSDGTVLAHHATSLHDVAWGMDRCDPGDMVGQGATRVAATLYQETVHATVSRYDSTKAVLAEQLYIDAMCFVRKVCLRTAPLTEAEILEGLVLADELHILDNCTYGFLGFSTESTRLASMIAYIRSDFAFNDNVNGLRNLVLAALAYCTAETYKSEYCDVTEIRVVARVWHHLGGTWPWSFVARILCQHNVRHAGTDAFPTPTHARIADVWEAHERALVWGCIAPTPG